MTDVRELFQVGDKVQWKPYGDTNPLYGTVTYSGNTVNQGKACVQVFWDCADAASQTYGAEDLHKLINLTRPAKDARS